MAVPVQIPLIAQSRTLTRWTTPRLPSQRQASAVPFDEPATFRLTRAIVRSRSEYGDVAV